MAKQPKKVVTKTTVKKQREQTPPPTDDGKKKRGGECQYAYKVKPYMNDIFRYVKCGVTEGQICEYYGIGKTAWADYKKKYPELTETLYKAKQSLQVELVDKAYEVAMGYDYKETVTVVEYEGNTEISKKVTVYDKKAKPDANMIQFLLINRFKDDFAREPQAIALRKKALELAEKGIIPPDNEGSI